MFGLLRRRCGFGAAVRIERHTVPRFDPWHDQLQSYGTVVNGHDAESTTPDNDGPSSWRLGASSSR
jgi:hypothetical protein